MGGGLKEGHKVTLIVQLTGKSPATPEATVQKFKDAVKKLAQEYGATVTEV
jgi:hypothetical protein